MLETVLGGLLCAASGLAVGGIGLLFVDPGGGGRIRRERTPASTHTAATDRAFVAFEPLDLGDAPLKWPSEQPRPNTALPPLPWPSETWTDDFFGAGRAAAAERSIAARAAGDGAAEQAFFAAAPEAPPQAKPKKRRKAKAEAEPAAAPEAAEVAGWVDEHGLAGAVERIRQRTGWDFQQAAHHLAEVMRARREGRL